MTSQYLISNQTSTPLFANDGTRYVPLPAWSVNTAILAETPDSIIIGKAKDSTTGTNLSTTHHYMMLQQTASATSKIYACVSDSTNFAVTEVSRTDYANTSVLAVADAVVPEEGTACTVAASGAWNFDVIKDKPVSGFTDAPLIVPVEEEEEEEEETADDGWSWTTWALIIGGILLLLLILGMIIYFATRKPKTPPVQTVDTSTDMVLL